VTSSSCTSRKGGAPLTEQSNPEQVTFTLDGRAVTAAKGEMLIAAAEKAGTYIPRFCYHPRMKPVGVCRMCLVEVDSGRGPGLQPACFIEATDEMTVVTDSEMVKKAQDGVLEFLLANHPLDCPVCDKGGECPLQDQTLAHGPGETRFIEEKRHFAKPIAISELVLLDRERCIQCSRCTRFADEVAGEALIDFAGRGDGVEVATFPGEPFSSYFSGNTVQICPVGALTATPYRFAARPWDLEQVESTCTGCAVGCRVAVQSSSGRLTRLLGIDSEEVNHSWLCDKGRFAFESINGVEEGNEELSLSDRRRRITEPLVRKDGELVSVSWGEALATAGALLKAAKEKGPRTIGGIGGAQLTNEGAFAWTTLLKGVIGTDSLDAQFGDGIDAAHVLGLPRATINETANACTVLLLAGDLREELPVLFLRLREMAVAKTMSLIDCGPRNSALSDLSAVRLPARPGAISAIARAITGDASVMTALNAHPEGPTFSGDDLERARQLIGDDGDGVVIVLGRPSVAEDSSFVEAAARTLHARYPKAKFLMALRRGNVMGALEMGMAPGILPGRTMLENPSAGLRSSWPLLPAERGRSTTEQLKAMAEGSQDVVILMGADPLADVIDAGLVERAFGSAAKVIAVTGHGGPVLAHAEVVLPAAVANERPGTTTNMEGRVTRLGQKIVAPGLAWSDWMIATELARELSFDTGWTTVNDVTDAIARVAPSFDGLTAEFFAKPATRDGVVAGRVPMQRRLEPLDPMATPGMVSAQEVGLGAFAGTVIGEVAQGPGPERPEQTNVRIGEFSEPVAPAPDNYSLRLVAVHTLYDNGAVVSGSPALAQLRPTATAKVNPYDLDRFGVTTGDRITVRGATTRLLLPVEADPGVIRGTLVIDANVSVLGSNVHANAVASLLEAHSLVTDVRLESL
jgi:NADH-quinone oxidoreductase subunit G